MIPLTPPQLIEDKVEISRAGRYQIRFLVKKADIESAELLARMRGETGVAVGSGERIQPGARYLFVEMQNPRGEDRFSFQTVLARELALDFGREIEFVVGEVNLEKGSYLLRAALLGSLGMKLSSPEVKGKLKLVRDSRQGYRGPRDYVYDVKDGGKMKERDVRWAAIDEKIRNVVSISEPLGLFQFESDRISWNARKSRRNESDGFNLLYNQYFTLADGLSFAKDGAGASAKFQKQLLTVIGNIRRQADSGTLSVTDIRDNFVAKTSLDPSFATRELEGSWGSENNTNYYGLSIYVNERLPISAKEFLPALIQSERLPKIELRISRDDSTGAEFIATQSDSWNYKEGSPVAKLRPIVSDRSLRIYLLIRKTKGFVARSGTEPGISNYEISRIIFVTARPN